MVYAFAMGDCNLMGDQFDKDCVHWGKELNIFNINDLEQVYKDIQKCCLSGYKDEVYQSIELLHPITYIRKISQNDLEISVEDYVKKQLYSEENVKKWKSCPVEACVVIGADGDKDGKTSFSLGAKAIAAAYVLEGTVFLRITEILEDNQ